MVDVSTKSDSVRIARASGRVITSAETLRQIEAGQSRKGDVLEVARLAGIMAAKRTGDLIPLCHPLNLEGVTLDFWVEEPDRVWIEAEVRTTGRTGVEMEALTAVSVAALTIYDMCKSIDRSMVIDQICLVEKQGGKSGHYRRNNSTEETA